MAPQTEHESGCLFAEKDCPVLQSLHKLQQECEQLRQLTRTDPLTGFFNFRHLLETLESEMERTRRTGLPLSLIMIDLDHFKRINDGHGHEVGNDALQWAATIFKDNIRCLDIPCRYGGEEFSIILSSTPLRSAIHVAEKLRTSLSENPLQLQDSSIPMTASFGVEVYDGRGELTANEFIHAADRYLLEAKENGRNRTCFDKSKTETLPSEISQEERNALGIIHTAE